MVYGAAVACSWNLVRSATLQQLARSTATCLPPLDAHPANPDSLLSIAPLTSFCQHGGHINGVAVHACTSAEVIKPEIVMAPVALRQPAGKQ